MLECGRISGSEACGRPVRGHLLIAATGSNFMGGQTVVPIPKCTAIFEGTVLFLLAQYKVKKNSGLG
eukprot:283691-Rhodomonas_salina.2